MGDSPPQCFGHQHFPANSLDLNSVISAFHAKTFREFNFQSKESKRRGKEQSEEHRKCCF